MGGLGGVHEAGSDSHALHCGDRLPADESTLADSADDDLSSSFLRGDDPVDCSDQTVSCLGIRLVVSADVR